MIHTLMTQIKKLQQINSNWKYEDEYGYVVDQDTGETICQQSDEKRGKLIAGAPEMVNVLGKILADVDGREYTQKEKEKNLYLITPETLGLLRRAIKKATE